jgi:hypothetical protein
MPARIFVAGAITAHPFGSAGLTWAFLQWVLGFRRLGYETYYVEQIDSSQCVDDEGKPVSFAVSANRRYFDAVMQRFGLAGNAALLELNGRGYAGLSRRDIEALAAGSDLFINLSGRFHLDTVLRKSRRRMYVDLDPGYVQIWQERYGVDMNLRGHDTYVTVGLNLAQADCPMPTCGLRWHTTLPPVVLDAWRPMAAPGNAYTTVADWRGYNPVEWQGVWYGQKAEEFLRVIDLPRRVDVPLEICLAIHENETDRRRFEESGWRLVSPRQHAATPETYRDYIHRSRAEFTVVKQGYAAGRTGWFGDRSACYLASGRPVVVQDTGIGRYLPTGRGLLTFRDLEEAAEAIAAVEADYTGHARAARDTAEQHLDSDCVLGRLLELAGV